MSKTIKLQFFSDPGHGWVRFPKKRLVKLGIADKITPYSYERNGQAFLEEDCDVTTLVNALKGVGYTDIKFVGSSSNRTSKIRSYSSYHAEA
jgi:hypothetical protein